MKNKGLCLSCVEDIKCGFARKFPVIYCEEFTDFLSRKENKLKKRRG